MFGRTFLFALILLLSTSIFSQPQAGSGVTQEMRTAANDAYQKQNWQDAVKYFEEIIKLEPKNAGRIIGRVFPC